MNLIRRAYYKAKHWLTQTVAYSIFFWENNNYDWDYAYLINLMRFKLSRMAKTIEENEIIVANHRVARQIRYAVYLIDEWQSDRYLEEIRTAHEAKWGKAQYSWHKDSGDSRRMITSYPKATTSNLHGLATEELLEGVMLAGARDEMLLDRLFKHMRKYLRQWWD